MPVEITFGVALVGAVLGIINTWHAISKDIPRIRVRTCWRVVRGVGATNEPVAIFSRRTDSLQEFPDGLICVEVINAGYVAVHIREVGVCPAGGYWLTRFREHKEPIGRAQITRDAAEKITLPYKIEPGTRFSMTFSESAFNSPYVRGAELSYVMTEDDRLFFGGGRFLRAIVKARKAAETQV